MNAPSEAIVADCAERIGVLTGEFGNRVIEASAAEGTGDYMLHDTFDGQIARAGGLLLACDDGVHLFRDDKAPLHQPLVSGIGFVADMPPGPVTEVLRGMVSALRRLLVVGEGGYTRRPLAVLDGERKTQARCEVWTLAGLQGREVFATIQRVRGYGKAYNLLRRHLGAHAVQDAPGFGDLATRLFPGKLDYTSRPAVAMAPDDPARAVANALIRAHLGVARRNEAGVAADIDTEFLHDYRVALRKVRSVVSLFKGVHAADDTVELKRRLGALMARTGRLRDLDVYLLERDRYKSMVPETLQPGLDMLLEVFARDRTAEQARFARYITGKTYRQEIGDLVALFDRTETLKPGPQADRPVSDFARRLIWKRYRKVCKIATDIDDTTPDARVHDLRIHCKKLRYAMELFAPLFDEKAHKRLVKALKGLQDTLGNFNDYSVQQHSLQAFVDDLGDRDETRKIEIASSVGALITVLNQNQLAERALVVDRLDAFDAPATRNGFRSLYHQPRRDT